MPGGNGTGPGGFGPMTGRAAGFCAGFSVPGYANPVGGRGYGGRGRGFRGGGFGRGRGFGWAGAGYGMPAYGGAPFAPDLTAQQELDGLKGQAEYLKGSLSQLNERIEQLENQKSSKE